MPVSSLRALQLQSAQNELQSCIFRSLKGAQDAVMSVRVCKENLSIIHSNYIEDKLLDQKGDGDAFVLQTLASR